MMKFPVIIDKNKFTTEYAYKMGIDCEENGANRINCDFRIFHSPETTKEWERGKEGTK